LVQARNPLISKIQHSGSRPLESRITTRRTGTVKTQESGRERLASRSISAHSFVTTCIAGVECFRCFVKCGTRPWGYISESQRAFSFSKQHRYAITFVIRP